MEVYSNAGQRWTLSEEESLIQNWPSSTIDELSKRHGRTKLAITARLQKLGFIPKRLTEEQIYKYLVEYSNPNKKIVNFFNERNIQRLFHFTDIKNLENILKHGLISRSELNNSNIDYYGTDSDRYDNNLDGISFSLTTPNIWMLHNKFYKENFKKLIILELDSLALTFVNFKAFPTNAANKSLNTFKENCSRTFEGADALKFLFLNERLRNKFNIITEEPTDLQSEIVVHEFCPSFFIRKIHLPFQFSEALDNKIKNLIKNFNLISELEIEYDSPHFKDYWSPENKSKFQQMWNERQWHPTWEVIDGI